MVHAGNPDPDSVAARPRPAPWLARALALLLLALPALARQDQPGLPGRTPKGDQPVMVATFGWGGQMPAERWSPITVYITTGERPISGTIVVEFPQDSTQTAAITVPFAATPNRTTPVPIVAALPQYCDKVSFMMFDESGSLITSLRYTRAFTDQTAQLPTFLDNVRGLFVGVGRTSLPESIRVSNSDAAAVQTEAPIQSRRSSLLRDTSYGWTFAVGASILPDELPISWTAYEGVTALVVNPASAGPDGRTADPRAQEAALAWLLSGGRLVILADAPGDNWRSWLPPSIRDYITLDPAAIGPLPATIGDTLRRAATAAAVRASNTENAPAEPPLPGPVERVAQRGIHLSGPILEAGWKVRWALDTQGPQDQWTGLLAEGPVGYGHIVILGVDPARTPETANSRAAAAVWRSALGDAVEDWLMTAAAMTSTNYGYMQSAADRASNTAVELLGDVPIVGDTVFYVIAAAMALLVLMVGPFDYFVLRRLGAGQRSWFTALLWIAVACSVAYAAPKLLRAAPTQINRLSIVDRMPTAPAGVGPLSYSAGLVGIYAGESGTAQVQNPDLTSWWRGVSITQPWASFSEFRNPSSYVPTVQAAAGGAAGSARGNPITRLPMALWTFRALSDTSIPTPAQGAGFDARIRATTEGYRALLTGVPDGAKVTAAALRVGDRWYTLEDESGPESEPAASPFPIPAPAARPRVSRPAPPKGEAAPGSWTGDFPDQYASRTAPKAWSSPPFDPNQYYTGLPGYPAAAPDTHPGPLLELAGPDRRAQAVDRYLATGNWAALYINLTDCPPALKFQWPSRHRDTMVLRLLVPLEEAAKP